MIDRADLLRRLDERGLIELTRRLVRAPSVNPPGRYEEVSGIMREEFEKLGLEVSVMEGEPGRPNVVGLLRGSEGKRTYMISGHMDVVPEGDPSAWIYPPFGGEVHDGKIWGRGSADMKCALAGEVYALKAVLDAGGELKGNLLLGATVDDETAGPMGMKYVLGRGLREAGFPRPDMVLVGEISNMDIVGSFKGRVWYRIRVRGKTAHGGAPQFGINAIEKSIALINEIKKMELKDHPLVGRDTINLGRMEGGTKVNIVPEVCTFELDIRIGPPQSTLRVKEYVESVVRRMKAIDPELNVEELAVTEDRDPLEIPEDHELVEIIRRDAKEVTGRVPAFRGSLSSGDLYYCIKSGIPGVWLGAGRLEVAHAPNEYVEIDKLIDASKIYALSILDICGHK
jgi:succinyl-diaminopimelate desuccinylase